MHDASAQLQPDHPVLLVLSGPSGVGKDEVLAKLRHSKRPWHFVVTATTRPMRPNECAGIDYIFMSPEDFQGKLAKGGFLEHANVYGKWYGVPKDQVQQALDRGQDVLLKVDVQGATYIKKLAPHAAFVFLAPPTLDELERRLRNRHTETEEQVQRRLQAAREEMRALPMFDYVVVNETDRVAEAVAKVEAIVAAERCRLDRPRVDL